MLIPTLVLERQFNLLTLISLPVKFILFYFLMLKFIGLSHSLLYHVQIFFSLT